MRKLLLAGVLAATAVAGGTFGCAYGGIGAHPNGTLYIARNDIFLFGALRKIYACTPNGTAINCSEVEGKP